MAVWGRDNGTDNGAFTALVGQRRRPTEVLAALRRPTWERITADG